MASNARKKRQNEKRGNLDLTHLLNMESFGQENVDDDNEEELEKELLQLMSSDTAPPAAKKPPKRDRANDLESMVAACMKDISDEEDDATDLEDPELLQELEQFNDDEEEASRPPTMHPIKEDRDQPELEGRSLLAVLDSRLQMYSQAVDAAKKSGQNARARRFSRGLQTLNKQRSDLLKGIAIRDDDIPPAISQSAITPPEPKAAETQPDVIVPPSEPKIVQDEAPKIPINPSETGNEEKRAKLEELKEQRKKLAVHALRAKKEGQLPLAAEYLKATKECDLYVQKLEANEISASEIHLPSPQPQARPTAERQFSRDEPVQIPSNVEKLEDLPPPDPSVFNAPSAPTSVMEALEQRLERYRRDEAQAKEEGNASRARRLGRICKQYTDAIAAHRKGRPINVEELPTPPGFAPIPKAEATAPARPPPGERSAGANSGAQIKPAKPVPEAPRSQLHAQVEFLLKQQQLFKEAAIAAKKNGDVQLAKEYLINMKGFDRVLDAAKSGVPVNMKTLPIPPQQRKTTDLGFLVVKKEPAPVGDKKLGSSGVYSKLEKELVAQAQKLAEQAKDFRKVGQATSGNKFDQLVEITKTDLEKLRRAYKAQKKPPQYHYEVRAFPKEVRNVDVEEDAVEVTVVSASNLAKDADAYCKVEFPYPKKETPFVSQKSPLVKKSADSSKYNFAYRCLVPVNPKDTTYKRIYKRQSVKVEIWNKAGFLRSDVLLGTASLKLQELEEKVEISQEVPLLEGRKPVGGKVLIRVRINKAIVKPQIEQVKIKWLVIEY